MHAAPTAPGASTATRLYGISVFCALDDIGPALLRAILSNELGTYPTVHLTTAGSIEQEGFMLLPTGGRPHFTVVLGSDGDAELERMLAVLGAPQDNRYYLD
jgi:hypothetical protein